jgi:transposase InsO family protein
LIKEEEIVRPNQVWVSDLTYIPTREGFLYLSLVMDAYSRKIIGHEVSDTLETTGCLKSLNMALSQLPARHKTIHHSDRGFQYCSHAYIEKLRNRNLRISMTEENHCYENAQAERVNGVLKTEYGLGSKFLNKALAKLACRQAIYLYNTDRPHLALNMETPEKVHQRIH